MIPASQFHGHVVHKHLIRELLNCSLAYERFFQKQSKYDAAVDHEVEGGVGLCDSSFDNDEIEDVQFKAIMPDTPPDTPVSLAAMGSYPLLPSQTNKTFGIMPSKIASAIGNLSLGGVSEESTLVSSPRTEAFTDSLHATPMTVSSTRQPKVWGCRDGKPISNVLFPDAKPNQTSNEYSIAAYNDMTDQRDNINIMETRFWDPMSDDWNPERFYDSIINKYYCPFVCE